MHEKFCKIWTRVFLEMRTDRHRHTLLTATGGKVMAQFLLLYNHVHNTLGRPVCVLAASTDGRRQSGFALSGALLQMPWTRTSTDQRYFLLCMAAEPGTDYLRLFDHQK